MNSKDDKSIHQEDNNSKNENNVVKEDKITPMPLLPFMTLDTLEMCSNLSLQSNDIFICSYPKSGTTWTQHIVISLLLCHRENENMIHQKIVEVGDDNDKEDTIEYDHVSQFAPFFEVEAHWYKTTQNLNADIQRHHKWLGWRIFNTHLRWNMLPKSTTNTATNTASTAPLRRKPKFIYIIRSPLDTCVSFYHHLSNQVEGGYEGTFNDFFQDWMDGHIAFGSWMDHICSFLPAFHQKEEDILLISYQEMCTDLSNVLDKMISFLELEHSITQEQKLNLLPTFAFSNMKQSMSKFQPISVTWKNNFQFLRQGQVGDSTHTMTPKQIKMFRDWMVQNRFVEKIQSSGMETSHMEQFISLME